MHTSNNIQIQKIVFIFLVVCVYMCFLYLCVLSVCSVQMYVLYMCFVFLFLCVMLCCMYVLSVCLYVYCVQGCIYNNTYRKRGLNLRNSQKWCMKGVGGRERKVKMKSLQFQIQQYNNFKENFLTDQISLPFFSLSSNIIQAFLNIHLLHPSLTVVYTHNSETELA